MDVLTPIWFLIDLADKTRGLILSQPSLVIRILSVRLDSRKSRWVIRASVLNRGREEAFSCEGFWSVFDPTLRVKESGTSFYWSPLADDDYDFENRNERIATIKFNERRFCWAEFDILQGQSDGGVSLFPCNGTEGQHVLALILECGRFKAYDYIVLNMPDPFGIGGLLDQGLGIFDVGINRPGGLMEFRRRWRLRRSIRCMDFHNYVRPT
jgi:hypothetical protein